MSYKDKYADAIESQFYDLENRILADIIRRIKKTGEITSTADWQINKLVALGYSSDEIETMIKDALGATYPEMFELYDKVIDWEYVRNKDLYEQINGKFVPYEDNAQLQQWLEAAKEQTAQTLKNLTATLGIVQAINGQYTFLPLTDYYQRTLDAAILDITSGAFDYNSVLKRTVGTLAKSGIRTIDYASGYSSRLPVAVRRAVMTGVSQMTAKISDYNADQLGADHFEIAWHEHARPSHREWQGKVWSKEELVSVCGLGTVTGLCGVNCYHNYYPFILGVSERNWSDEWLEEQNRKEDEPRTFKGKEYTAYEATQKQRRMEVSMRAQRVKIRGLEEGGADPQDIIIAQARYQGQIQEYKAFSSTVGLKPQMQRVYIDGLGKVANSGRGSTKAFAKSTKDVIIKKEKLYRKKADSDIEPMPKKQLQRIVKGFKRNGGVIQMNDITDTYLKSKKAEAITYDSKTILLRQRPSRAAVFEELIHATQYKQGKIDGSKKSILNAEIEAQEKLLRYKKAYQLTDNEIKQTEKALKVYQKELEKLLNGGK